MLKKIILPLVLLIFAQQNFYGINESEYTEIQNEGFWIKIKSYLNYDAENKRYPRLWWLWAFLDNVPFQYGGSKIWKYGEAYYGLSNGIGFFPSFLNFGWLKVGIVDAHINVINTIIKFMKTYTEIKCDYYFRLKDEDSAKHENPVWLNSLKWWLFYTVVTDIHLFSFKFFNCVKIKIISIGAVVTSKIDDDLLDFDEHSWYFCFNFFQEQLRVQEMFFKLSPCIEINIPELINYYFNVK